MRKIFNKARREEEKQNRLQGYRNIENAIQALLVEAGEISNPDQQIKQLNDIGSRIISLVSYVDEKIEEKANKASSKFTIGGLTSGAGTAFAITPTVAYPPIAIGVAITSLSLLFGGVATGNLVKKFVTNKLEKEAKPHRQNIAALREQLVGMYDSAVRTKFLQPRT